MVYEHKFAFIGGQAMVPNYILRVKINDKVIYERKDLYANVCIQNRKINSYNTTITSCGRLPNKEVMKHAR